MRFLKSLIISLFMVFGVFGIAHAVTFDGTNHNPVYTEGITEVYAVTDNGIPVYVPVFSMERCMHEDGSSQVACVWHTPTQGNKNGAVSFMKLGGNEFATISHEAARILLAENSNVQVNYVPETVEVPENVVEFTAPLPYNENVNSYTQGYAPCQFEDSVGCYWNAQTMGNGIGSSFVVDPNGNYDYFPGNAQTVEVDENFAGAECDAQCEIDMANESTYEDEVINSEFSQEEIELEQKKFEEANGL